MKKMGILAALFLALAPALAHAQGTGGPWFRADCATLTSPVAKSITCQDMTRGYQNQYDGTGWQSDAALSTKILNVKDPRWGCKGDGVTDDGPCIQSAVNALAAGRGGIVYFPVAVYLIGTQVTVTTNNIVFQGQGRLNTQLSVTATGLNPISVTGASSFAFAGLRLTGPGATSTAVGLLLTNANQSTIRDAYIDHFNVGVRFSPGANSSYLNLIQDSLVVSNNTTNIDAQAGTHALTLLHVTFGGSPAQTGIKVVDSSVLRILGGDCEGVSATSIDIDSTSGVALYTNFVMEAIDFESNAVSNGEIRLGATHPIYGVTISASYFHGGAGATYPVNAVNVNGLTMLANVVTSGYTTASDPFLGKVSNVVSLGNRWNSVTGLWAGFHDSTASNPMVKIGGVNTVAPSSNLEVQGTSGITISRDVNATNSRMQLNFRQRDASSTWVNYGYWLGRLNDVTAGAVTAEFRLNGKIAGVDTDYLIVDNTGFRFLNQGIQVGVPTRGNPGTGKINSAGMYQLNGTSILGAKDTAIGTGVGSIKMKSGNNATNAAWLPVTASDGTVYYIPAFTTNNP